MFPGRYVVLSALVCLTINLGIAATVWIQHPEYLQDYRLAGNPDAIEYVHLGRNLFLNGSYSRCHQPPLSPDMLRTPVYPIFVGGLEIIGGIQGIYLAQVMLHVGSCVLLYWIVRPLLGIGAGLGASAFMATDLMLALSNYQPMSEPLSLFLMLSGLALVFPAYFPCENGPNRPGRRFLGGGVLLGLSILTRPAALYLPLVLAFAFLVGIGRMRESFGRRALLAVLLVVVSLLPAGAWIARNAAVFSVPRLTSVEANNLVYFAGAGAFQVRHQMTLEEAQAKISEQFKIVPYIEAQNPHAFDRSEAEVDRQLRAVQWQVLGRYPGSLALSSMLGIVKASFSHAAGLLGTMVDRPWHPPGTSNLLRHPSEAFRRLRENGPLLSASFVWQTIHVVVAHILAIVGALLILRDTQTRSAGILLMLLAAYFYLIMALFGLEAYCRCRIPLLPFAYAFAGWATSRLAMCFRKTSGSDPHGARIVDTGSLG